MIPVASISVCYLYGSYSRVGSKLHFCCPGGKFVMPFGFIPDLSKGLSITREPSGAVSGTVHIVGWASKVDLSEINGDPYGEHVR